MVADVMDHDHLRATEASEPQDWMRLRDWLAARGMDLAVEPAPRQFAGGLANLNYQVMLNGAPAVLRRPPAGPVADGASDMAREARVLAGLNSGYPLAPRLLLFCDDAGVLGAPFQLIEFRPGVAVRDRLPSPLAETPGAPARLLSGLIAAMVALHQLDPAAVGLGELGRPEGFLTRQAAGWTRRAHAVFPEGLPPAARLLADWLPDALPPEGPAVLLHSDFKFDNMLVDPATLMPTAVIDWDMATRGDARFDLAVLLSYWIEPTDPADLHALRQVPSLQPGFAGRHGVIAAYEAAAGHCVSEIEPIIVLARFRLAIAWMQLYRLYQRGALSDPRYATFEALALAVLDWTAQTRHQPL
jgi:aminoglycoside phosphotransferase (APT) family kinase protein